MPPMPLNCPSAEPSLPSCLTYSRLELNSRIRSWAESATQMFPLGSTATPFGSPNLNSPVSEWVKLVAKQIGQLGSVLNVSSEPLLGPPALVAEILKW